MNEFTSYTPAPVVSPSVQAVRKVGGSALFLIVVITYTLMAILSFVNLFLPNSEFSDLMRSLAMLEPEFYDILPTMQTFLTAISLIFFIPTILAIIGYWMCFGSAKSTQSPYVSTGGLSLVQAVTIIQLIGICALSLLLLIIMVPAILLVSEYSYEFSSSLSLYSSSSYYSSGSIIAFTFFVFALIILFMILYIIYYAKAIGTISRIKGAASGIMPPKQVSMYVIVMNFVFSFFILITTLVSLSDASILATLSNVLTIVFHICIAIVLINMRKQLHNAAMETMSIPPVYSQDTQYQPQYQNSQGGQQVPPQNPNPWEGQQP